MHLSYYKKKKKNFKEKQTSLNKPLFLKYPLLELLEELLENLILVDKLHDNHLFCDHHSNRSHQ